MALLDTFVKTNTRIDPALARESGQGISTGAFSGNMARTSPMVSGDLTPAQLRGLAKQSSAVRPAKDTINREISYMPWAVKHKDPEAEITDDIQKRINEVAALFLRPNANKKPLSFLLTQVLDDLLTLDRLTIEIIRDRRNRVVEIIERDAGTIKPKIEDDGIWSGYEQRIEVVLGGKPKIIPFKPEQIIFCSMFPRPDRPTGTPIIDTIVNEIVSLIMATQHIGKQFTEDEIPPGILWLGEGMAREIQSRVKASLTQGRRKPFEDFKLRVLSGGDKPPAWIEMKRSFRDVQMRELKRDIEEIVYINFGIMPSRMGRTEKVNRSNIEQQAAWQDSALIGPIMSLLSAAITTGVIQEGFGYDDLIWKFVPDREEDQESLSNIARTLLGPNVPVFTINGIRQKLYHEDPWDIPGANEPLIITPDGIRFLSEIKPSGANGNPPPAPPATAQSIIPDLHEVIILQGTPDALSMAVPDMSLSRFQPIARATNAGHFDPDRYDALAAGYSKTLKRAWNDAQRKIVASIKGKARVHRQVSVDDPDRTREEIAIVLALLLTMMDEAGNKAFSVASDIGIQDALALDARAVAAEGVIGDMVRAQRLLNKKYLSGSLLRDLLKNLRETMGAEYETIDELLAAANGAFDGESFRLDRYGNAVISVGAAAWVLSLDATKAYIYHWRVAGDDRSCDACLLAAASSPYRNRNDLPFLPGGSPQCDGRCRCSLDVEEIGG